ncbi:MAG TPA: glycine zipper 2TM domain-containing protein [Gammaproteobacteria bacterium]|nr:glycine zipper 2TM domain-containing protein [Gammaproteobacteria bacterium]
MRGNATYTLLIGLLVAWVAPAFAQPPAHAPAHGWRKKNDPYYVGYTGKQWERDFDISSGSCNRQEIATVIGGIAGGVIANRVADEHKPVATIIGVIAGAVIGNRIGRELDEADRGCFGHALEIAQPRQRITWTNEQLGVRYELSPGADRPRGATPCREYTLVTVAGRDRSTKTGIACQSQPGVWQVAE